MPRRNPQGGHVLAMERIAGASTADEVVRAPESCGSMEIPSTSLQDEWDPEHELWPRHKGTKRLIGTELIATSQVAYNTVNNGRGSVDNSALTRGHGQVQRAHDATLESRGQLLPQQGPCLGRTSEQQAIERVVTVELGHKTRRLGSASAERLIGFGGCVMSGSWQGPGGVMLDAANCVLPGVLDPRASHRKHAGAPRVK